MMLNIEPFVLGKMRKLALYQAVVPLGARGVLDIFQDSAKQQHGGESKMPNYDETCSHYLRCTSNICPLDPDIAFRNYIQGDGVCVHILNYLEGKETPFNDEIKRNEKVWRKKIPDSVFQKRLKSRIQVRERFQKVENKRESTRTISHDGQQAI